MPKEKGSYFPSLSRESLPVVQKNSNNLSVFHHEEVFKFALTYLLYSIELTFLPYRHCNLDRYLVKLNVSSD